MSKRTLNIPLIFKKKNFIQKKNIYISSFLHFFLLFLRIDKNKKLYTTLIINILMT